jgi:glyoxylase-like metal-dependent hydrolase (beta-lactamase superfamily II)
MDNPTARRAAAAALLLAASLAASAGAPQQKTQAGWQRTMVGDIEVTALSDGTVKLPVDQLLTNVGEPAVRQAMARNFLSIPTETSVNGYLVNTGTKLVLIDAGAASLFGPTLGNLLANLRAAGYAPEQVDEVYATHLHPDHVGGLVLNGQRAFPNAVVRADRRDVEHWLSAENLAKAPEASKGFYQGATASLKPYQDAGKLQPFDGDTALVPGVRAVAAHGHTPGHTTYVVESQGQRLALWGDLMHVAAVQFPAPAVTIRFDSDSNAAQAARMRFFQSAAADGTLVGIAHVPFPGLGRLRAEGNGYVWVPLNFSGLK